MINFCKSNAVMLSYACIAVPQDNILRYRKCKVRGRELKFWSTGEVLSQAGGRDSRWQATTTVRVTSRT